MTNRRAFLARCLRYSVPILLTILWIAFIFGNSLRTGVESGNQSKQVQEWVNTVLRGVGFSEGMSEGLIRKLGHFSEFAVLALLYIGDLAAFGLVRFSAVWHRSLLFALTAIPVCFIFGSIDELLQNFSVGRAPQITDVLIDTLGGSVSALLFCAVFFLLRRLHEKKNRLGKAETGSSDL